MGPLQENVDADQMDSGIPYRIGNFKKVQWLIHKGQDVRDTSHNEPYVLRMENRDWLEVEKSVTIRVTLVKTDKVRDS